MTGQYIELLADTKQPAHRFKDGVGARSWSEVRDCPDVALIVPEGYAVLDFDSAADAEAMLRIVDGRGLRTKVMQTTRGIHCWFRVPEGTKNAIRMRLAVGLRCDRKAGGRNAYVKIRQGGVMRPWVRNADMPLEDVQELPEWLCAIDAPRDRFDFLGMGGGSGRNQELYNYIIYLQTRGMAHEAIRDALEVINAYVFAEPLPEEEMGKICREEAFAPQERVDEAIAERAGRTNGFDHAEFAEALIEEFRIIEVNGLLYIYDDGYYQADDRIIEGKMIELFPTIKQAQRSEVLSYLRIKCHVRKGALKTNPFVVNLSNTRLDLRDGRCLPFTPEAIEFDRIPVTYDPKAYSADLDKMLNRVFCGDHEVRALFEEIVGSIMLKSAKYVKAFVFYGSGSNGKSTIMDLLKDFTGAGNYSTLSLQKISERFSTVQLDHMLANFGDDIPSESLRESDLLKAIVGGNSVTVERKGEQGFTMTPYATLVFSANKLPSCPDKTEGFYRRWAFIPFNARFTADDDDYDPFIADKISTPEAMSYLLNLGVRGAQRLMRNRRFTEPTCVRETLDAYKVDNSTVLSWLADSDDATEDRFLATSRDGLYTEFVDWCRSSGIRPSMITGKKSFNREVVAHFGFDPERTRRSGGKRFFVSAI